MSTYSTGKCILIRKALPTLIISVFFLYSVPAQAQPTIWIDSVNSTTVELYDKFEIFISLEAEYVNPYNPEEIDLRAVFTSPTSATWKINGFFYNYENDSLWKVRFSPNEVGLWSYKLIVTDINGTDSTNAAATAFEVISSDYHGWIKVSTDNLHYLMYDDGTSFYGVGMHYAWDVNPAGLNTLVAYGANIFGYWNSTYDWGGNGGGRKFIESLESGIGKYDQHKCARIDEILSWAEERNLKMRLNIWFHDALSETVWPYNDWENNPYKYICASEDFYEDSLAWEYQKKQYRYITARWGYSRSLFCWDIINEIDGTDGWVYGDQQIAEEWLAKVHNCLKENDPYKHLTHGTKSGGGTPEYYWDFAYDTLDVAARELYEIWWNKEYPGDDLRSSLWNFTQVSRKLWRDFEKPALISESGYTSTYADTGTAEYIATYHNALWGSLTNGLSVIPMWWMFWYTEIVTDEILNQMLTFSNFVEDINFAHLDLDSAEIYVPNCDAYAMESDSFAFGWAREENGDAVGSRPLILNRLQDGEYHVVWYNCWEGVIIEKDTLICTGGILSANIPSFDSADIAFKVLPSQGSGVLEEPVIAGKFLLLGNSPEPFTNSTTISYILPEELRVSVKVYDLSGRLISTLQSGGIQSSGKNTLEWNAGNLTGGVYFYRVEAGDNAASGKCVLLK